MKSAKEHIKKLLDNSEIEDPFQETMHDLELDNSTYSVQEIDLALNELYYQDKIEMPSKTSLAFGKTSWIVKRKYEDLKYYYLNNGNNSVCKEIVVATSKEPNHLKSLIEVIKRKVTSKYGIPASEMENLPLNDLEGFEIDRDSFLSYPHKIKY